MKSTVLWASCCSFSVPIFSWGNVFHCLKLLLQRWRSGKKTSVPMEGDVFYGRHICWEQRYSKNRQNRECTGFICAQIEHVFLVCLFLGYKVYSYMASGRKQRFRNAIANALKWSFYICIIISKSIHSNLDWKVNDFCFLFFVLTKRHLITAYLMHIDFNNTGGHYQQSKGFQLISMNVC